MGIIELDGFKLINDVFGNQVGDEFLKHVAHQREEAVPEQAFVGRLGGGGFAFAAFVSRGGSEADGIGIAISLALRNEAQFGEARLQPKGSVGIALCPTSAVPMDEIFRHADYALYAAKRTRTGAVRLSMRRCAASLIANARSSVLCVP